MGLADMTDTPAKGTPKVRDLDTLKGVNDYVRGDVADAVKHALDNTGAAHPIGVVLARRNGDKMLDHAVPAVFGGIGVQASSVEELLRINAVNLAGAGVLYIHPADNGNSVRFVLEHRDMGDHEWTARIVNKRMGEIMGPRPPSDDDQTRLLPPRYMN